MSIECIGHEIRAVLVSLEGDGYPFIARLDFDRIIFFFWNPHWRFTRGSLEVGWSTVENLMGDGCSGDWGRVRVLCDRREHALVSDIPNLCAPLLGPSRYLPPKEHKRLNLATSRHWNDQNEDTFCYTSPTTISTNNMQFKLGTKKIRKFMDR